MYYIDYPLKSLVYSNFPVDSFGLTIKLYYQIIMLVYHFFLMSLDTTSSTMLSKRDDSGHSYLIPDINENTLSLSMMIFL